MASYGQSTPLGAIEETALLRNLVSAHKVLMRRVLPPVCCPCARPASRGPAGKVSSEHKDDWGRVVSAHFPPQQFALIVNHVFWQMRLLVFVRVRHSPLPRYTRTRTRTAA